MERRLSVIFAADMVGYSRLMEVDELGTLERQKAYRRQLIDPALAEHKGRIVKTTGDGLLAEFPSVVDAVQCAVNIQRAMADREADVEKNQRIEYRIGINLGDVIVDDDNDIYGDGVNAAARLEQLAEPGGICISGTTFDHLKLQVEAAYEPLGEVQVKNISQPIRAYKVIVQPDPLGIKRDDHLLTSFVRSPLGIAFIVLLGLTFVVVWLVQSTSIETEKDGAAKIHKSDKLSIAVLPFNNLSGDADQEYFVDGMTEDLITDLSKFSSLFVIARNSVFTYKGRNVEPKDVAKELRVRYILNGSVRAVSGRVRINAHLIDADTGGQIWAERFDRAMGNIFELQDDVTQNIVKALALKISPDEAARIDQTEKNTNPEVYDLYLRGVQALRQFTPESIAAAREHFLRALTLDTDYARAYATLAFTYTAAGIFYQEDDIDQATQDALLYAHRALELDETLPQGHFALAIAYLRQSKHSEALDAARSAVRYDPNYADGYVALANVLVFTGDASDAVTNMKLAMELNPRFSAAYLDILGRAYFVLENYDSAVKNLSECVNRDPVAIACRAFLAAAHALSGNVPEAQWQVEELMILEPDFRLGANNISIQFQRPKDLSKFEEGLKLAGVSN